MMCSSWKISVFGILALILAFGLVTTDALAQAGTATVTTTGDDDLRAAGEATLVFAVSIGTAPQGDNLKTSTVSINIPSVWSRPIVSNDAAIADEGFSVGEVFISDTARGRVDASRRQLIATFTDGAGTDVTFSFKTTIPHRMGTYNLAVTTSGPAFGDPADITIEVGPIASGGDVFGIDWTGGTLYTEPDTDDDHPYEGRYLIVSKQSLQNLVLTFTAPGTVTKGSVITLTRTGLTAWSHADDSEVSVTGNVDVARPSLTSVTATLKSRVHKGAKVVFTIKNIAEAPEVADDANVIETGHTLLMQSAIVTDITADPLAPEAAAPTDAQFDFVVTKPAGRGTLGLNQADTTTALTHVVTGAEGPVMGTLTFTWADLGGIGSGSTYEITIPEPWPQPVLLLSGAPAKDGAVTAAGKVEGRILTGDLTGGASPAGPAITYHAPKAPAPGAYMFAARATAGRHTSLAPITPATVHVTVDHGKGSLALMRGGAPLTQTTSEAPLGNLMFVFTPEGYMAKDASFTITQPTAGAWTAFRVDNGDHVADEGEVTVGAKASLVVGTAGAVGTITVTAIEAWTASDRIIVNYKNVKAPKTDNPESYTFQGQGRSFAAGTLANLTASPTIGIGRAADGGGTLSLSTTQADAGSMIGNLMITFAAGGNMAAGSVVEVSIPATGGWPAPNDEIGRVTASFGTLDTTATTMTVTTDSDVDVGNTIVFTYGNGKLTAPTTGATYTFTAKSTSSPTGIPTALTSGGATITVDEVAAGSIAINSATGPLSSAAPDMALGNLSFIFTAGAQMASGSQVEVTVPVGWTPAFLDNNDGTDSPGEVSVAGAADLSVSGGGGTPWLLTATTNAILEIGNTLTITYKMVTSPSAEGTYEFATKSSIASGGTLLGIKNQQRVTVRTPVADIGLTADSTVVFTGEEITLTVNLLDADGEAANALGAQTVMLSSTSDSGVFSSDMVTIADNTPSAMATYSDSMAGSATLTATLGEMSATADVTVKSTISNLRVDGEEDPPPVRGDATIIVKATGQEGKATVVVTQESTDADGMTTQQAVVSTKGLDVDPDATDVPEGDVAYTRDVDLGGLEDGLYTVTVNIGDDQMSVGIEVVNDRTEPMLSEASAWPGTVADGDQVALRVVVTSANEIMSVTADVSALDSTRTEPIALSEQQDEEGVYTRLFTINMANANDDGEAVVSFTATDRLKNEGTADAPAITLKNDVTPPELSMESAMPGTANDGTVVTISVSSESGLTVTADASSIGGGMVTLAEGMMAANGNGANGMTNGMDANGMTNGNGANGMDAAAMPAGNGMYSGTATVTGATDGAQMITITATDGSGNSSTATVSVMIDNTGPALTMASADPAMAMNGAMVTISVSTESGATVTADASAIGGDAATALAESADTAGSYSASVTIADDAMDGEHAVSISATDALGNASDAASVTVTVDNTAPALADAAITPDWALNGDTVSVSVSTESGATVTADASAIGGAADLALAESADTAGMYSADVVVTGAAGGDQMVSITASDALGNMSDAASASVSIHVVTSASFSPAEVSTGDTVMVSAMGTAGLTATFSVFDADGNNIVTDGSLTEDAETAGSYSGSFEVVIDAHPTGTYWVSATIGQASMTAEGALTIDHLAQFELSIAAGTHLIHVPLDVTHIDGVAGTIDTVGDLYDALGDSVNFIISLGADGTWNSYLGDTSAGGAADAAIGDDTGLIAVMSSAASVTLAGNALGTGGASAINLSAGNNLVGVPLDPAAGLDMISDAVAHPAVSAIVVSNAAGNGFNTIAQAGDPGDGAIMGGVGYIVVAGAAASIPVVGMAWDNSMAADMGGEMTATSNGGNGASTAPSIGFQTPVLQVQGKLIDEAGMVSRDGLNVSVRNVTRGTTLGSTTAADDYSMTFVKLDTSAAKIGDVLEIRADSSNPLIGVRPVQHVVTADDVLDSRIDLPDLVAYEIPAQTELLANYPNPFNPETWIPFRLAEDSNVSLSVYGATGSLVRTIDIGFMPAAVYEGRSDAIYWDGRNDFGEQVSSGIYFYHLNAGSFSATRKMVIVK